MDKKKWVEIQILNYPKLGEGIVQYVKLMLDKVEMEEERQAVFLGVCKEILDKRIARAYEEEGELYAQVWGSPREIEFTLRDLGRPYASKEIRESDSVLEDLEASMEDDYWIEDVRVGTRQLGREGQMMSAKIAISYDGDLIRPEKYDTTPLDTNFNVKEVVDNLEDITEAIACLHQEYGYSYAYEGLYKVEEFKEIVKSGAFSSYLAVNDHGEVAGHLGLSESPVLSSMPEISSVVIKRQFRGLHFGDKMFEASVEQARIKNKPAVWVQPTAFHTGTQRICNKLGFTSCGFLFEYVNKDILSEYNVDLRRMDLTMAVKLLRDYSFSFYCPDEIREFAMQIFEELQSPAELKQASGYEGITKMSLDVNSRTLSMKLVIEQAGEDFEELIFECMNRIQQEKLEMVEVLLLLEHPSSVAAYEYLRKRNYIFSGILPGSDNGVYCVMQYLCGSIPKFDKLVTTDGYNEVRQALQKIYEEGN